ncbi:MAG: phosphatidate cytidylyltransferase [Candidatus Babeliales bacterium]
MASHVAWLHELQLRLSTGFLLALFILICIRMDPFIFSLLTVSAFLYIWFVEWPRIAPQEQFSSTLLATLWLGIPCASLLAINTHSDRYLLAPFFITLWVHDSGAYIIGKLYGKHLLAPLVSPGKTIEGFLGGLIVTFIWLLYAQITGIIPPILHSTILLSCIVSSCATAGDLFESWLKREARIKDTGDLLPGHGGLLDRIDSALPLSFLLYLWLSNQPGA